MKIVKFERPGTDATKEEMIKDIQDAQKILVITVGPGYKVTHHSHNLVLFEALAAIEVVKGCIFEQLNEDE